MKMSLVLHALGISSAMLVDRLAQLWVSVVFDIEGVHLYFNRREGPSMIFDDFFAKVSRRFVFALQ